jgi:hypothetical protein
MSFEFHQLCHLVAKHKGDLLEATKADDGASRFCGVTA